MILYIHIKHLKWNVYYVLYIQWSTMYYTMYYVLNVLKNLLYNVLYNVLCNVLYHVLYNVLYNVQDILGADQFWGKGGERANPWQSVHCANEDQPGNDKSQISALWWHSFFTHTCLWCCQVIDLCGFLQHFVWIFYNILCVKLWRIWEHGPRTEGG